MKEGNLKVKPCSLKAKQIFTYSDVIISFVAHSSKSSLLDFSF